MSGFSHTPVLVDEALDILVIGEGVYLDATLGGGGHAIKILEKLDRNGWLGNSSFVGIDQDIDALNFAKDRLKRFKKFATLFELNFSELATAVKAGSCKAILMDLGVSSYQIDTPDRGFSFQAKGHLDMRMSLSGSVSAKDIVNTYSEKHLAEIMYRFGQERKSRAIAKAIVAQRKKKAIETTDELKTLVLEVIGNLSPAIKAKSMARVFQALRIEVNQELDVLKKGLEAGFESLAKGGRLGVISYHSLEDRMVKRFFKELAEEDWGAKGLPIKKPLRPAKGRLITKKPISPSLVEIEKNRRARSAKFRVIEKL